MVDEVTGRLAGSSSSPGLSSLRNRAVFTTAAAVPGFRETLKPGYATAHFVQGSNASIQRAHSRRNVVAETFALLHV